VLLADQTLAAFGAAQAGDGAGEVWKGRRGEALGGFVPFVSAVSKLAAA
jgi:hypothetical protein